MWLLLLKGQWKYAVIFSEINSSRMKIHLTFFTLTSRKCIDKIATRNCQLVAKNTNSPRESWIVSDPLRAQMAVAPKLTKLKLNSGRRRTALFYAVALTFVPHLKLCFKWIAVELLLLLCKFWCRKRFKIEIYITNVKAILLKLL